MLSPNVSSFLNDPNKINPVSTRPKAYLNWILLDEQFNYVASSSGAQQVPDESVYGNTGSTPVVSWLTNATNILIDKSGYLYVYASNETPNINVFFDNMQVTQVRGPVLEETHYYPFGLTMAGISSKAAGSLENKRKWNAGSELNTDFDINLYETHFRSLDPQLGRFWQIDPKPTEFESPYAAMKNNPILFNDPLGDTIKLSGNGVADFLKLLNSVTGNTYENKDGILTRTNKKLNTKSNKNISGSLSKGIEAMIKGKTTNSLNLRNDDKSDGGIFFDKFNTREVDMKDFGALKNNVQKASLLGHVLAEYNCDPQEACNTNRVGDRPFFDAFHQTGIAFENQIASEMTGTKTSLKTNVQSSLPPNKDGIQDIKQNFNFGTFQFNVIFNGYTTPGYWKGNSIYVGAERGSTGVIKSVDE